MRRIRTTDYYDSGAPVRTTEGDGDDTAATSWSRPGSPPRTLEEGSRRLLFGNQVRATIWKFTSIYILLRRQINFGYLFLLDNKRWYFFLTTLFSSVEKLLQQFILSGRSISPRLIFFCYFINIDMAYLLVYYVK